MREYIRAPIGEEINLVSRALKVFVNPCGSKMMYALYKLSILSVLEVCLSSYKLHGNYKSISPWKFVGCKKYPLIRNLGVSNYPRVKNVFK